MDVSLGWLATALSSLPLTEANVVNVVNLFLDERDVSSDEVREFTNWFLWTVKRAWPASDEGAARA